MDEPITVAAVVGILGLWTTVMLKLVDLGKEVARIDGRMDGVDG